MIELIWKCQTKIYPLVIGIRLLNCAFSLAPGRQLESLAKERVNVELMCLMWPPSPESLTSNLASNQRCFSRSWVRRFRCRIINSSESWMMQKQSATTTAMISRMAENTSKFAVSLFVYFDFLLRRPALRCLWFNDGRTFSSLCISLSS